MVRRRVMRGGLYDGGFPETKATTSAYPFDGPFLPLSRIVKASWRLAYIRL